MTEAAEFALLADQFRTELLAHCYRMLGSIHDAEDQVQETMIRAWRFHHVYDGRAPLRNWLYKIATNSCLRALHNRARRPVPAGLGEGGGAASDLADPAAVAASRAGLRLVLTAAFRHLTARQGAVLILRDGMQWPARDVADLLGTTTNAINSQLWRARVRLAQAGLAPDEIREPQQAAQLALLCDCAAALEDGDPSALSRLLCEDTWAAAR